MIDIHTRTKPSSRSYYMVMYEDMTIKNILEYRLDKVYQDSDYQEMNESVSFAEYLKSIFASINSKILAIAKDKEIILLDSLLSSIPTETIIT